jgi:O-antigen ligase
LDDAAFKSIFWNPGWYAWYFSMAFGVTLGFSLIESSWRRVALLGALAVCYAYFLTNPQRGGFLAVHVALAIVLVHWLAHSRRRWVALFRGAVAAVALAAVAAVTLAHVPRTSVWFMGVRRLVSSPGDEVRSKLAVTALHMWQHAPLCGIGEGAFAWRYREFVPRGSPLEVVTYGDAHNTWLQILSTRGIVGLSSYVWLWLAIAVASVRALKVARRSLALPFVAGLAAFFVYSFVQGMFYLQAIQVFFWGLFALLASQRRRC